METNRIYLTELSVESLMEIIERSVYKAIEGKQAGEADQLSQSQIIDRAELCKRLSITEPTVIRWEKKGKIPCFHVGKSVRYKWEEVIKALEKKGGKP